MLFKLLYLKLFLCVVLPLDAVICLVTYLLITYNFCSIKGATFIKFLAFLMRRLFENHIFFKSLPTIVKNFDKSFVNILQNRTMS